MRITKKNINQPSHHKSNSSPPPNAPHFPKRLDPDLIISSNLSLPSLKYILSDNNFNLLNIPDNKGETFLSYAILRNKNEIINYLLSLPQKISIHYYDKNGKSYLHKATLMANYSLMRQLIEMGHKLNCQDNEGNSPLHIAVIRNDIKAIKILINANSNPNLMNNENETPISIAQKGNDIKCLNSIYKKKNWTYLVSDTFIYEEGLECLERRKSVNVGIIQNGKDNGSYEGETSSGGGLNCVIEGCNMNYEEEREHGINEVENDTEEINTSFKLKDCNLENNFYSHTNDIIESHSTIQFIDNNSNNNLYRSLFPCGSYTIHSHPNDINTLIRPNFLPLKQNTFHNESYFTNQRHQSKELLMSFQSEANTKSQMYLFLKQINMEHLAQNLISNGFDDLEVIISQSKRGIGISDRNLIEANITSLGDRARIIVHIDHIANNYPFASFPIDKVYSKESDTSIFELLKSVGMERYNEGFEKCGYHNQELLLMHMLSKQPLTAHQLANDLEISEPKHWFRIINKLKDEKEKFKKDMISQFGYNKDRNSDNNLRGSKNSFIDDNSNISLNERCYCIIM